MTSVGQFLLDRIDPSLPLAHGFIRSETVFEKVEPSSGFEHPSQFIKRTIDPGNGAQSERAERAIAGIVIKRKRLAMKSGEADLDSGGGDPFGAELAGEARRFDRVNEGHLGRIARRIATGTEAEFDYDTGKAFGGLVAHRLHRGSPAHPINHTRNDAFVVEAHRGDVSCPDQSIRWWHRVRGRRDQSASGLTVGGGWS